MQLFQNAPSGSGHQPNVSVLSSNSNPSGRKGPEKSVLNKLQDAVNDCCVKIEDQIKSMLNSTEPDVIRLLLDAKFNNYFVQKVNNRYIKLALFCILTQMLLFDFRKESSLMHRIPFQLNLFHSIFSLFVFFSLSPEISVCLSH